MSLFGQSAKPSLFGQSSNNQQANNNPSPFASLGNNAQQANNTPSPFASLGGNNAQQSSNNNSSPFASLGNNNAQDNSNPSPFANLNKNSQQSSAGTLFGSNTAQQTSAPSLFGASTATSQPQSSAGNLFGASTNQQQNTGSSLFGGSTNQQQNTGSSLFGGLNNAQSSAQTGSSLLGTANQQGSSSLFGGLNNQQQKPSLSLFGSTNQNQTQQQQPQKPSLFGSLNAGAQQPQQQTNSLWGNTSTQAKPLSLSLGQGTSQNTQQTVPGVKIDVSNIRGTTRFSDLHESIQDEIVKMDAFIAQQISWREQCEAIMPSHGNSVASLSPDLDFIKGRCEAVEIGIDNDGSAIKSLKGAIATDADDARRVFRAVENLKLPSQYQIHPALSSRGSSGTPGAGSSDEDAVALDLTGFFSRTADEMAATLRGYAQSLAEIERHMGTVEAATAAQGQALAMQRGARGPEDTVRELAGVLREFETAILGVAGRVGAMREGVTELTMGRNGYGS